MNRFSVTFMPLKVPDSTEVSDPASANAKYLKARFESAGYTTRDSLAWLHGIGCDFHLKMRRWWLNITVGIMADQPLYIAFIHPDVNETSCWRRIMFSPRGDLLTAATMVDDSLRQSAAVKTILWQDKSAFKTRDFTNGYEHPKELQKT